MDILIFALLMLLGIGFTTLDFYKSVPYLGVIGGIIFILLGLFIAADSSITMTICNV